MKRIKWTRQFRGWHAAALVFVASALLGVLGTALWMVAMRYVLQ